MPGKHPHQIGAVGVHTEMKDAECQTERANTDVAMNSTKEGIHPQFLLHMEGWQQALGAILCRRVPIPSIHFFFVYSVEARMKANTESITMGARDKRGG